MTGARAPAWASAAILATSSCAGAGDALPAAALLGVAGAGSLLLRRRAREGRPAAPLRLEARAPLGRDSGVAVVRLGDDRFLVGYGRHGVRELRRIAPPGPEAEGDR
jgi:flagellar protein FliO/FliZ